MSSKFTGPVEIEGSRKVFVPVEYLQTDCDWMLLHLKTLYQVDEVVIIERHQKGKLAGSATSFKLEASIQLIDMPVELITPAMIKEQIKLNKLLVDFDSLELKKFQKPAFEAAYAYQQKRIFN